MVNRMRATRAHRDNRRSHHALTAIQTTLCSECNSPRLRHTACGNCGKYRGKTIIDMTARIAKVEKKAKAQTASATAK